MDCIIPCLNVKIVAKALQALSKIGDELFIEAKEDKLTFVTFNLSKTVCGQFNFLDSFFSNYNVNENALNDQNNAITCKIHMKILLPLFKGTHMEKKLDFIKVEYENNCDFMLFKLKYKCDDILMMHKLHLMDPESLTIANNFGSGTSQIIAESSFFNQLLSMFSGSDDDITFEISKQKVMARNYFVGAPHRPKSVRSQVNLNASEFCVFQIEEETAINFSLKPFRTVVSFAEAFNLNIGFRFEKGGRPLSMKMNNPTFEVNFLVATLNPYSDNNSTLTAPSLPAKITQIHSNNTLQNLTVEDREALINENWEDFDISTGHLRESEDSKSNESHSGKRISINGSNKRKSSEICVGPKKKQFLFLDESSKEKEVYVEDHDMDVISSSPPESPRTMKVKYIFSRCYEPTLMPSSINGVLAENSDSE